MPPFVAVPFAGAHSEPLLMRVTKGPTTEAHDIDVVGYELADPEDRFAPVRAGVPRKRRKDADVALGDIVGGCGRHRNGDGFFIPIGGIAGRLLG